MVRSPDMRDSVCSGVTRGGRAGEVSAITTDTWRPSTSRRGVSAPSPRSSRGRDEQSSLLEGWGEGLSPRAHLYRGTCTPSPAAQEHGDLSPQAAGLSHMAQHFEEEAVVPARAFD